MWAFLFRIAITASINAMTPRDILHHYLLLDKPVYLQFSSQEDLKTFRTGIHTAKHRLNEQFSKLGADCQPLKGKSIFITLTSKGDSWPKNYKVYVAEEKKEQKFKILLSPPEDEQGGSEA